MIDMHSHVIPFIDDGSNSMEDSIRMIKEEIKQGVDTIVCTPHHFYTVYEVSRKETEKNFNLLKEECIKQGLKINLYLGSEIYFTRKEPIIEKLNKKEILTFNNSQYILIEFSPSHMPEDFENVIYDFSVHKYKVIIAHISRYPWMTEELVRFLISEGALIQVNAGALFGDEGLRCQLFTRNLLKKGMVHMIASDVHFFRKNYMEKAYKLAKNPELFNFNLFL